MNFISVTDFDVSFEQKVPNPQKIVANKKCLIPQNTPISRLQECKLFKKNYRKVQYYYSRSLIYLSFCFISAFRVKIIFNSLTPLSFEVNSNDLKLFLMVSIMQWLRFLMVSLGERDVCNQLVCL